MSASTTQNFTTADFPAGGSARQKLGHAVKCAALAPSTDAWQPWEFRLVDEHVELSADASWPALTDDSSERELLMRCGEALLHLKLAMQHFGCLGRVELFPNFDRAALVARIHYGSGRERDEKESALFQAMVQGRNESTAGVEAPMNETVEAMLLCSMAGEKAWLEFSRCESTRNQLVALVESGAGTPAATAVRGIQRVDLRLSQWARPWLTFVVRSGGGRNLTVETDGSGASAMAALAVIKAKTDDKHGWLATGQALARVRLQSQVLNISSRVFNRSFRHRRVREELRTSVGHKGFVQAVIGFGSSPARWIFNPPEQPLAPREPRVRSHSGLRSRFD